MLPLEEAFDDPETKWRQAEVFRLVREEAAEILLTETTSALYHRFTPVRGIRFESKQQGSKGWWSAAEGFAIYTTSYVEALYAFDFVVRASRTVDCLKSLNEALTSVMQQAAELGLLGCQVNWHQNVQWALRGSRFGISGYLLQERYENLTERTTLSERLETIGGPIFYRQTRTAEKIGPVEPVLFSEQAEDDFGSICLSLASWGRRYASDWIDSVRGPSYRLLSD